MASAVLRLNCDDCRQMRSEMLFMRHQILQLMRSLSVSACPCSDCRNSSIVPDDLCLPHRPITGRCSRSNGESHNDHKDSDHARIPAKRIRCDTRATDSSISSATTDLDVASSQTLCFTAVPLSDCKVSTVISPPNPHQNEKSESLEESDVETSGESSEDAEISRGISLNTDDFSCPSGSQADKISMFSLPGCSSNVGTAPSDPEREISAMSVEDFMNFTHVHRKTVTSVNLLKEAIRFPGKVSSVRMDFYYLKRLVSCRYIEATFELLHELEIGRFRVISNGHKCFLKYHPSQVNVENLVRFCEMSLEDYTQYFTMPMPDKPPSGYQLNNTGDEWQNIMFKLQHAYEKCMEDEGFRF